MEAMVEFIFRNTNGDIHLLRNAWTGDLLCFIVQFLFPEQILLRGAGGDFLRYVKSEQLQNFLMNFWKTIKDCYLASNEEII